MMRQLLVLLLSLPIIANAQAPIADMSVIPPAPIFECLECDPTDSKNPKITALLDKAVLLNFRSCQDTGENIFQQEASVVNCLRGAAFVRGSHNNLAYYVYAATDVQEAETGLQWQAIAQLLFYSYRPDDITSCAQMVACRVQKGLKSL